MRSTALRSIAKSLKNSEKTSRGEDLKKHLWRFTIVVMISFFGFALNEWYFFFTKPSDDFIQEGKPIAYVIESEFENEKKADGSELWNVLAEGDGLFVGDSLRTNEGGGLKIQFVGSDKIIEIEAESLLVLQLAEGKINLDLLDGNVEVKKTTDSKIATTDGPSDKITIAGESIDSKAIDLKAQVKVAASGLGLEIVNPEKYDTVHFNPENPEPFIVQWKKLPPEYATELWMGPAPNLLKKAKSGNDQLVSAENLKEGNLYWQIRATGKNKNSDLHSAIYKTKVVGRYAPAPVAPVNQSVVRLKKPNEKVKLNWLKSADYKSITVEIFTDAEKKKAFYSQKHDNSEIDLAMPQGTYYWRFLGWSEGEEKPVVSALYQFSVELKSQARISLSWAEDTQSTQSFVGDVAMLNLAWTVPDSSQVRNYRIKIIEDGGNIELAIPQMVFEKYYNSRLQKPGRYLASIEALDEDAEKIGATGIRRFEVKPLPLLARMELKETNGDLIRTNDEGNLKMSWLPITNSQNYIIQLSDSKGMRVIDESTTDTSKELVDLLPGNYQLSLYAVDQYGRPGEKRILTVVVPQPTGLFAPKVKKWEVD